MCSIGVLTFVLCLLQLLTNHYEQNWKYYCLPSGWGSYGTASEDELLLTKKLFWGIFDSLSQRVSTGTSTSLHFTVIDALVAVFNIDIYSSCTSAFVFTVVYVQDLLV